MKPAGGIRSASLGRCFPLFLLIAEVLISWQDSKLAATSPAKQVAIGNLHVAKTQHSFSLNIVAMQWISELVLSRKTLVCECVKQRKKHPKSLSFNPTRRGGGARRTSSSSRVKRLNQNRQNLPKPTLPGNVTSAGAEHQSRGQAASKGHLSSPYPLENELMVGLGDARWIQG